MFIFARECALGQCFSEVISQSMSFSLFVCHNMPILKLHVNDSNYSNVFVLVIMVRISVFVHVTNWLHKCLISTVLEWKIR